MDARQASRMWLQSYGVGWLVCLLLFMSHMHLILFKLPTAIVDQEDCVMVVLADWPNSQDWDIIHVQMSAHFQETGTNIPGPHKEWWGNFISLSTRVSYRGGQMVSVQFTHSLSYWVMPLESWEPCPQISEQGSYISTSSVKIQILYVLLGSWAVGNFSYLLDFLHSFI